jgi:hypothetical protein
MAIEFYDIKLKKKIQVDESTVCKVTFETRAGIRYGLKAKTVDGRKLIKFVHKSDWEKLKVGDEAHTNEIFTPDEGDEFPR